MRVNMTRASARAIALREIGVGLEHRFDGASEEPRDPERERQAGVIAVCFDRNDCLPRDAEEAGELRLRPESLSAEKLDAVLNRPIVKEA
jgi:hypothetical protein